MWSRIFHIQKKLEMENLLICDAKFNYDGNCIVDYWLKELLEEY